MVEEGAVVEVEEGAAVEVEEVEVSKIYVQAIMKYIGSRLGKLGLSPMTTS